jgi:2,4-dienoyl-CoA reductase-like NADH-dependent reductase (Old Yellow Enzyme family)
MIPGFDDGHPVSAALLTDPPRASRSPQPERLDASQHHYGANGLPTDRLIADHAEKARGGCGTAMMFGSASVRPLRPAPDSQVNLWKPEIERWLVKMADAIHAHGALCPSQMAHVGHRGTSLQTEWPGRRPSATTCEVFHQVPHVMRDHEIEQIVRQYAVCARRLKDGRFDGSDLAFYCDSFADQFWNPKSSARTDEYGGSLENRMRVSLEILEAARTAVGREFIVGIRLSARDHDPDSLHHETLKEIAPQLDPTRLLDYLTITEGRIISYRARGINIPAAYLGKDVFGVHVEAGGTMTSGETMAELVAALERAGCRVDAILLMCCPPDAISTTLPRRRSAFAGSHRGLRQPRYRRRADGSVQFPERQYHVIDIGENTPERYAQVARQWRRRGLQQQGAGYHPAGLRIPDLSRHRSRALPYAWGSPRTGDYPQILLRRRLYMVQAL